jgi:hypothetical protein
MCRPTCGRRAISTSSSFADTDPDIALKTRYLVRQFIERHFGDNDIGAVVTARTFRVTDRDFHQQSAAFASMPLISSVAKASRMSSPNWQI